MDEFGEKHSHHGGNLKQHMEDVGIQGSQTIIDHGEDEGKPISSKYEAKQQPNWQQVRTGTAPADDDLSGEESISNEDRFVTDAERETISKQLSGDAGSEIRHHQNEPSTSVKEDNRGNEGEGTSGEMELANEFGEAASRLPDTVQNVTFVFHGNVILEKIIYKQEVREGGLIQHTTAAISSAQMPETSRGHGDNRPVFNVHGDFRVENVLNKQEGCDGAFVSVYSSTLEKQELSKEKTEKITGDPPGGILISGEWDRVKLHIEAKRCRHDRAYALSIRYLEIRDAEFFELADDLEVLLEKCENLDTIIFKSHQFDASGMICFEFKKICRSITKYRNNMKYLEFSNMNGFGVEHAKILGQLIQDVKVETLNLHGSNLEQYLHDVFIVSLKKLPSAHRTNIVFGQDEVNCLLQPTGAVKEFGLSGCKITVPTNALAEPKQITLQVLAGLVNRPGNLVQVSPVLRFLPSGLHFNKPITVQVPVWNVFKGDSINLKVFKRFDENADWEEECVVKYTGGKFIQYETNHFCDDVVCANVEEECEYQLMVYKSIYTNMNDSYELHIYCKPSNQDIANEVYRDAQSCELQMCFPPLRFTLPATGHIEVQVEQEDSLLDCNVVEGRKVFECANLGNYHTTYIRCDLSDDTKRRGIGLKFTAMVNQRSEVKLIKAIWKEPPPGDRVIVVQNLHSVHNTTCSVDEIKVDARDIGQLDIASSLEGN